MITYAQLYDKLEIPPVIRRHMVRTGIAAMWIYSQLDQQPLERTGTHAVLLHDIGKFPSLNLQENTTLLRTDPWQTEMLLRAQERIQKRFGDDDEVAITQRMLNEFHIPQSIIETFEDKETNHPISVDGSVALTSDLVAAPEEIGGFTYPSFRIEDVIKRTNMQNGEAIGFRNATQHTVRAVEGMINQRIPLFSESLLTRHYNNLLNIDVPNIGYGKETFHNNSSKERW